MGTLRRGPFYIPLVEMGMHLNLWHLPHPWSGVLSFLPSSTRWQPHACPVCMDATRFETHFSYAGSITNGAATFFSFAGRRGAGGLSNSIFNMHSSEIRSLEISIPCQNINWPMYLKTFFFLPSHSLFCFIFSLLFLLLLF